MQGARSLIVQCLLAGGLLALPIHPVEAAKGLPTYDAMNVQTDRGSRTTVPPRLTKLWTVELAGGNSREAPVIVDLDQDGSSEIVVVLSGTNFFDRGLGRIEVLRADGSAYPGWPIDPCPDAGNLISSPVVADLNADGVFEIVVGVARNPNGSEGGWLDGAILEVHAYEPSADPLEGYPIIVATDGVYPHLEIMVADIDHDGSLDILTTHFNWDFLGIVSAYHSNGLPLSGWPLDQIEAPPSPVSVVTLGQGGSGTIVVGSDRKGLFLLNSGAAVVPGWPVGLDCGFYDNPITAGDIDLDGEIEIVTVSWREADQGLHVYAETGERELYIWRGGLNSYIRGEAALVDVNGDLQKEIFIPTFTRDDYPGYLDCWNLDGSAVSGWPVEVFGWIELDQEVNIIATDLDGDGSPEILLGSYTLDLPRWPVNLRNKAWIHAWHSDGGIVEGFPVGYPIEEVGQENGALAIGDVLGRNSLNLVSVRCANAWSNDPKTHVSLFGSDQSPDDGNVLWARYQHDPYLSGNVDAACDNGTVMGTCSHTKPFYCSGKFSFLKRDCQLCGCEQDWSCVTGGWCRRAAELPYR